MRVIADKLGIDNVPEVLSKAAEFERLLQTKSMAGSNLTETSKLVICLDLAANLLNIDFDMKAATSYSGLRPSVYKNSRKIIQNLLELHNERLTISTLCFGLHCTAVQSDAEKILLEYQKQSKQIIDLDLPQYVCMAVYHACRIKKVKVSKSKLIEKSRLKPAQWTKLDADWSKFVGENFKQLSLTKENKSLGKEVLMDINEDNSGPAKEDIQIKNAVESYENWKERILQMAYEDLDCLRGNKRESHFENNAKMV